MNRAGPVAEAKPQAADAPKGTHTVPRERTSGPRLQRKCAGCGSGSACTGCQSGEDEPQLQRHPVHDGPVGPRSDPASPVAGVPHSVREVLGAPGVPLPVDTRREMEAGFGHDFARVRVHHSSAAAADVSAHSFTVGSHIVFGPGNWSPGTPRGRYLLAHELAHVVQQGRNGSVDLDRLSVDTAVDSASEREADATAEQVLAGRRAGAPTAVESNRVQRHALCAPILNLPDTQARGIGIAAHNAITADFNSKVAGATRVAIPGAAAVAMGTEGCEERTAPRTIKPQGIGGPREGIGRPDLAARVGTDIELAEIKIGTWTCVPAAEAQVLGYATVGMSLENAEWRKSRNITSFSLMSPSRFTPRTLNIAGGAAILVGWCAPGVIVYKPISRRFRQRKRKEAKQDASQKAPSAAAAPVPAGQPAAVPASEPATDPATQPQGEPSPAAARSTDPAADPATVPSGPPPIELPDPTDVAVAARLASLLQRLARQAPKKAAGAGGRALGPVYAAATIAAVILVMSKGAEASVGLEGDDAIEAAFKSMSDQGAPVPDDLKEAIKKDPALKQALMKASKPETADEAKRELGERLVRTITENRDQFTDEELEVLMQSGEGGGAIAPGDPTVAQIKEQIRLKKQGATKGQGGGGLGLGPSAEPTAEPAPNAEKPPPIELTDETKQRLAESPNTRTVLKALLGKKGERVDEEFVKSLLDIVAQADPPLTPAEVAAMTTRVASAEGRSRQEVLDSVRTAITERGQAPPAAAGTPGGTGGDQPAAEPGTPGGQAPAAPAAAPAAPSNALPISASDTSEAAKKKAAGAKGEAKKYADTLNDPKTQAYVEGLPVGQLMVAYEAPKAMFVGAVFPKSYLIGRLEDGRSVMGSCTMSASRALGGNQWEALVVPGAGLYLATGEPFGKHPRSKITIDFGAIQERRKAQAAAQAGKGK